MRRWPILLGIMLVVVAAVVIAGVMWSRGEPIRDEALRAGREPASFPAAADDYFHDMDGGVALTAPETQGRNTWVVWPKAMLSVFTAPRT